MDTAGVMVAASGRERADAARPLVEAIGYLPAPPDETVPVHQFTDRAAPVSRETCVPQTVGDGGLSARRW